MYNTKNRNSGKILFTLWIMNKSIEKQTLKSSCKRLQLSLWTGQFCSAIRAIIFMKLGNTAPILFSIQDDIAPKTQGNIAPIFFTIQDDIVPNDIHDTVILLQYFLCYRMTLPQKYSRHRVILPQYFF
jgi:hypothetical protein